MNKKQKRNLIRIIITALLLILLKFISIDENIKKYLYIIPYLLVGYDILINAVKGIVNGQVFDENFLMTVATVGAIGLGDYQEAVSVMLFYQIGELFQSYAISKTRKNISELMDIRPDYANIEKDGNLVQVDPEEVKVGDNIVCKVGEKIPLDGVVLDGTSSLNTSALTGESKPKSVKAGDEVISGSINMESPLLIKVSKEFSESTVSKILDLVENATSNKSKSENFISKFAQYYTPIVCGLALLLAIVPPLFNKFILGNDFMFSTWIQRSFTFLVISCPCALVISIPLSFFGGIGGASNAGILIKGSNYLEKLAKTKIVAFDKTGTMTKGVFEVTTIHNKIYGEDKLLEYAAHAEAFTNHPIGKSIIKEYKNTIDKSRIKSIKEIPGEGIKAVIDNHDVLVGNELLLNNYGIEAAKCDDEGTIVHITLDGKYIGHIHIGDIIKPTAKDTIDGLKKLGVKLIALLTGDDEKVAKKVSNILGIENVYANLLPQDKVEIANKLIQEKEDKDILVFVGDGINDAPVLALADVGVSMGALGSDAAIEAADVVLMDDNPLKLVKAIKISQKCMRIVYENIYFAIGVKIVCLILGAFGIASMWLAIFADVGVMVIDVLNAIRALNVKRL